MSLEKGLQELSKWATTLPPGSNKLGHNRDSVVKVSGNRAIKQGGRSSKEANYIDKWPPYIGPSICGINGNSYEMFRLFEIENTDQFKLSTLRDKLQLLWKNDAVYPVKFTGHRSWRTWVISLTGMDIPNWVEDEDDCLVHGDSTVANCMLFSPRKDANNGKYLRLIDPCPPDGRIPSYKSVDVGKMLQSYVGWEWVLAGRKSPICDIEIDERAIYWLMVHCFRIRVRELTAHPQSSNHEVIIQWSEKIIKICKDMLDGWIYTNAI